MAKNDVCVIGSLNYDIIMKQKRMPCAGETYTADSITYAGGGKGANQAVQCAKLGLSTAMAGKVGSDSFGDILLERLKTYGVDCSRVERSSLPTGVGVVHALEDGTVFASIITGANFDMDEAAAEQAREMIKNSAAVILQLEIPVKVVERILTIAKEEGVFSILNAAPAKPVSGEALRNADCVIVNETEASFYTEAQIAGFREVEENREKLEALCGGTVIVTLGDKGSALLEGGSISFIPPEKVDQVAETTGAGDSYIGAFAYGKLRGMDSREACEFASRAAAVTVSKIGAQEGMPCLEELGGGR